MNIFDEIKYNIKISNRAKLEKIYSKNLQNEIGTTPLMYACEKSKYKIVEFLLKKGANPNKTNNYGISSLMIAALNKSYNIFKILLKYDSDINLIDKNGRNALFFAAKSGAKKILRELIEMEVSFDIKDIVQENTPLIYAVKNNRFEISKILLKKGADPNLFNEDGNTAINIAKKNNNTAILALLEKHGGLADENEIISERIKNKNIKELVYLINHNYNFSKQHVLQIIKSDINKVKKEMIKAKYVNFSTKNNKLDTTPLLEIVKSNNNKLLKTYFDYNSSAKINYRNSNGETAIFCAAKQNNIKAFKLLFEKGARIDILDIKGENAITIAIKKRNYNIIKYFCKKEINKNCFNKAGNNPLTFSLKIGDMKSANLLLNKKKYVLEEDNNGDSSFKIALDNNYKEFFVNLVYKSKSINNSWNEKVIKALEYGLEIKKEQFVDYIIEEFINDKNILLKALNCKYYKLTEYLIEVFSFNGINKNLKKIVRILINNNHSSLFKKFIDKNIDFQNLFISKETLLTHALKKKKGKIARIINRKLNFVNIKNKKGQHPLEVYLKYNINDSILLDEMIKNLDLSNQTKNKCALILILAVKKNNIKLVKKLISNDINININIFGNCNKTPLHIAIKNKNDKMIKLLVSKGANILSKDKNQKSPLEYVYINGHVDNLKYLLKEKNIKKYDEMKIKKELHNIIKREYVKGCFEIITKFLQKESHIYPFTFNNICQEKYYKNIDKEKKLPQKLEKIIYASLGGYYKPSDEVKHSHEWKNEERIRQYLGTYWPRSYFELYYILNKTFRYYNKKYFLKNKTKINILGLGVGSGGCLFGIIDYFNYHKFFKDITLNFYVIDKRKDALKKIKYIKNNYLKKYKIENINIRPKVLDFKNSDEFKDYFPELLKKNKINYDIIYQSKFLNEFYFKENKISLNLYYKLADISSKFLSKRGMLIISDITSPIKKEQMYISKIINKEVYEYLSSIGKEKEKGLNVLLPLSCAVWGRQCKKPKKCFMKKEMVIKLPNKKIRSKFTYKVLTNKSITREIIDYFNCKKLKNIEISKTINGLSYCKKGRYVYK